MSSPLSAKLSSSKSPSSPFAIAALQKGVFGSENIYKDASSLQLILPSAALNICGLHDKTEQASSSLHSLETIKGSLDAYVAENLNGKGGPRVDSSTFGPNAMRAASPLKSSRRVEEAEPLSIGGVNVLVGTSPLPPINISQFMGEKQVSDRRRVQAMTEWLDKRIKGAWIDFTLSPPIQQKSIRDQLMIEQALLSSQPDEQSASAPETAHVAEPSIGTFTSFPSLAQISDDLPSPSLNSTYSPPEKSPTDEAISATAPIKPVEKYEPEFEFGNRTLLASTLKCVSACATSLIQHTGSLCYEEGALLARLWNLQTSLMDSALSSSKKEAARWSSEAKSLRDKVKVLDPLIDWERDAKAQIDSLSSELESTKNLLALASSERDATLRENNKIILHYRKELKEFKKKQRRDAFKLACKVKNQLKQLELMQKDRDQLIAAVNSTKAQVAQLQSLATGLRVQVSKAQQGEDLESIDADIKAMQQAFNKINDMVKETEDSYFASEEQLTLVSGQWLVFVVDISNIVD